MFDTAKHCGEYHCQRWWTRRWRFAQGGRLSVGNRVAGGVGVKSAPVSHIASSLGASGCGSHTGGHVAVATQSHTLLVLIQPSLWGGYCKLLGMREWVSLTCEWVSLCVCNPGTWYLKVMWCLLCKKPPSSHNSMMWVLKHSNSCKLSRDCCMYLDDSTFTHKGNHFCSKKGWTISCC